MKASLWVFVVLIAIAVLCLIFYFIFRTTASPIRFPKRVATDLPDCPIWMYWEGRKPTIIKMCEESVEFQAKKANLSIITLSPNTISSYVIMPSIYFTLTPSQKSDILRCALLYRYGGIWLDSDLVGVGSFDLLYRFFTLHPFFAYYLEKEDSHMVCCLISQVNSKISKLWFDKTNKLLCSHHKSFKEKAFGINSLDSILKKNKEEMGTLEARRSVHPIPTSSYSKTIDVKDLSRYKLPYQPFIVLFHSMLGDELRMLSEMQVRQSDKIPCVLVSNWSRFE